MRHALRQTIATLTLTLLVVGRQRCGVELVSTTSSKNTPDFCHKGVSSIMCDVDSLVCIGVISYVSSVYVI